MIPNDPVNIPHDSVHSLGELVPLPTPVGGVIGGTSNKLLTSGLKMDIFVIFFSFNKLFFNSFKFSYY